jgi:hypothetical protein
MESLNFELERGSMCHVVHGENCEYIVSENNDMWMQISANGSNVCIQIFPRNIEESYIGKECQENEELKYIISCRNEAEAVKCCDFFADFINTGYGDFTKNGKAWLVALDLEDINEIFSGGEMLYHRISLGTNENKERLSELCEECNIQTAQTVFICIYGSPKTMLDTFDSITKEIESKLTGDANVWVQFVHDDLLNEEIVIHLIYR